MNTSLILFLLARILEDEALALRAAVRREDHLWVVTGADNAVGVDYNPVRVLADCEAKRRILRRCAAGDDDWIIRNLAGVYSSHPDWDEAWRA